MQKLCFLLLVLLPAFQLFANKQPAPTDILKLPQGQQSFNLSPHLKIYEDSTASLSLEQVRQSPHLFSKNKKEIPNYSGYRGAVWATFSFIPAETGHIWLEFADSNIEHIQLYVYNKQGQLLKQWENGFIFPYYERELKTNLFFVKLEVTEGETCQAFVRFQTDRQMKLQARLATLEQIVEDNHRRDVVQGIYFGFVLVMILYNLFVFISVRDVAYLYYVAFVACIGFFIGNWNGYAAEFFWPGHYWFNKYATSIALMAAITGTTFSLSFLRIRQVAPRLYWPMMVYIGLAALVILLNLTTSLYLETSAATKILIFFNATGLLALGVYLYRKGEQTAKFYSLAWCFLLIGIVLNLVKDIGLVPTNSLSIWSMQGGSAIEILLFSFALADRINQYRKDKEKAQGEAMASLQENERLVREQNQVLEEKVTERTAELSETVEELNQTNEELHATVEQVQAQKKIIEKNNQDIMASINYARRIQQAMLPLEEEMQPGLRDFFVLYEPKNVVSGDFYWCHTENGKTVVAAVDCTGHGVPGAFMSLLGGDLLHETVEVRKITGPGAILTELHRGIRKQLRQKETSNRDGMDIALCTIDHHSRTLAFAGAKNPLVYIEGGEVHQIAGDRLTIGGRVKQIEREFTTRTITFSTDTTFYIFSDGLQDQFGGSQGRKFGIKRLRELLLEAHTLPMPQQKELIATTLQRWMLQGDEKQIDDMLLLGFRPGAVARAEQPEPSEKAGVAHSSHPTGTSSS